MNPPTQRWLIAILLLAVLLRVGVAALPGRHRARGQGRAILLRARRAAGDRPRLQLRPAVVSLRAGGCAHRALVLPLHRVRRRASTASPARTRWPPPAPGRARRPPAALAHLSAGATRRDRGQGSGDRGQGTGRTAADVRHPGTGLRCSSPGIPLVPLLAAFLAAIYAYFVLYGAMVQTEAFYICALLWSLERALALGEILRPRWRPSLTGGERRSV